MSVGLYDDDFATYTHVPFNLELMKYSTFYKGRGEIVALTPFFVPERYTKFIIRKDYFDGRFPPNFLDYDNVTYGGLAFTNNKYVPLDEEIEAQVPDTSIYAKFENTFITKKMYKTNFRALVNSTHLRLSLDGRHKWENYEKQFFTSDRRTDFIFHDYNLADIEGAFEVVQDLLKTPSRYKIPNKIGTKFPLKVYDTEALLNWGSLPALRDLYTIQYNGILEDTAFVEFINRAPDKKVLNQFEYNITGGANTPQEVIQNLPKIYKQVLYARSVLQRVKLVYDEGFFFEKEWERVLDLINIYLGTNLHLSQEVFERYTKGDTLFAFARNLRTYRRYKNEVMIREEAQQLFRFLKERHYELFSMFYEVSTAELKGGKLYSDRYRDKRAD